MPISLIRPRPDMQDGQLVVATMGLFPIMAFSSDFRLRSSMAEEMSGLERARVPASEQQSGKMFTFA